MFSTEGGLLIWSLRLGVVSSKLGNLSIYRRQDSVYKHKNKTKICVLEILFNTNSGAK